MDAQTHHWRPEGLQELELPEPGSPSSFDFALGRNQWRGVSEVSDRTEVPGPCLMASTSLLSGLTTAFLTIATVGMIVPARSTSWRLVESVRGPDDAEHASVPGEALRRVEPVSCPPDDFDTRPIGVKGRISYSQKRRALRHMERMRKAGMEVTVSQWDILVRGTPAQLAEKLHVTIGSKRAPGLCPSRDVCTQTLSVNPRRAKWQDGISRLRLESPE